MVTEINLNLITHNQLHIRNLSCVLTHLKYITILAKIYNVHTYSDSRKTNRKK